MKNCLTASFLECFLSLLPERGSVTHTVAIGDEAGGHLPERRAFTVVPIIRPEISSWEPARAMNFGRERRESGGLGLPEDVRTVATHGGI
jgi:hypothetical protein